MQYGPLHSQTTSLLYNSAIWIPLFSNHQLDMQHGSLHSPTISLICNMDPFILKPPACYTIVQYCNTDSFIHKPPACYAIWIPSFSNHQLAIQYGSLHSQTTSLLYNSTILQYGSLHSQTTSLLCNMDSFILKPPACYTIWIPSFSDHQLAIQ